MEDLLAELGTKYMPSKRQHDYLKHYTRHFGDRRLDVKKVVEIGAETGSSLRMWEDYFPNATIYGIDVNPGCREHEKGRIKIFIGDQGDPAFLDRFVKESGGELDIMIDDGSHLPVHQISTFNHLFPHLSEHGIYVIEDVAGCVGDENLVTVNEMLNTVKNIMFWPKGLPASKWSSLHTLPPDASWRDRNIVGLAIYRWLVFVMKGHNPDDNPYLFRT